MKEECEKSPHHREIHAKNGEPNGYQNASDQVEQSRNDHIPFDVNDELCHLWKSGFGLIGNGAKFDGKTGSFEQNEHDREHNQESAGQERTQFRNIEPMKFMIASELT